jgi:transposase
MAEISSIVDPWWAARRTHLANFWPVGETLRAICKSNRGEPMADAMLEARTEGRAYRRVEVITGHRRRQNWPAREKTRIVMESLDPEANISEVARRNGVSRGLLTVWRRQARELGMAPAPKAMFAAVRIENDADQSDGAVGTADKPPVTAASTIEVEIGDATIRVPFGVDLETLDAVITALRGAR